MRERYFLVCTFKKDSKNLELKVDVQKKSLRLRGKMTIDVLVSSNLSYFIQMTCVLKSYYSNLYHLGCTKFGNKLC